MNLKLLFLCLAAAGSCYAIEHEFGEGCQFIDGECYKRCAKGTHAYTSSCSTSHPTWSETTCENPVARDMGAICDMSRCDCDPPTIRDTINNKCVLAKDCPAPGSKPTGPPIDDSYLYVVEPTPRPPNRESKPLEIPKTQPKMEFGEGCQYVNGRCYKRCAKGTHAYTSSCSTSHPTWSETTCENPVARDMGAICDMSRCDCDPPTIRDTINNKCVLPEDCPVPGSKPTGPPIDDSYLYVVEPTPRPPNRESKPLDVRKIQPKMEFGEGCQYVNGRCYKRCAKGTHAYTSSCSTSHPTWSETTCENPVARDMGAICDMSRCDCDPPTIRDTINNKCVLPEDCPAPGSKPTGPPIDDSYLYVVEPTPRPPNRESKPLEIPKTQPKMEFGEGCQYVNGRCYKRCAKGTHAYTSSCSTSHPTWSETTCENPVARDMGAICDMSRCDCDPPTIRDTINNKCVLPEDCPAPGSKPTGPPVDDSYLLVDPPPRPTRL